MVNLTTLYRDLKIVTTRNSNFGSGRPQPPSPFDRLPPELTNIIARDIGLGGGIYTKDGIGFFNPKRLRLCEQLHNKMLLIFEQFKEQVRTKDQFIHQINTDRDLMEDDAPFFIDLLNDLYRQLLENGCLDYLKRKYREHFRKALRNAQGNVQNFFWELFRVHHIKKRKRN
jgi:hypothetical protein